MATRKEAEEQGLGRYFTGKTCGRGHFSERYTKSRQCVECMADHSKKWQADHPGRQVEINRKWRRNNPEKAREQDKIRRMRRRVAYAMVKDVGIEALSPDALMGILNG